VKGTIPGDKGEKRHNNKQEVGETQYTQKATS